MMRKPFDPKKSAAMRKAASGKMVLPVEEERSLIESMVDAGVAGGAPGMGVKMVAVGGTVVRPMGVKAVAGLLQGVLAANLPAMFFIQGEISNFRTYDRGHAFFTLKEPGAELPCVCWKDALARMRFKPKDGMEVVARGSIKLYEPQGKVQLYVEELVPKGVGGLELAFRQLCEKLKGEGLFEQGRKRAIPRVPEHVVIVTSRTGDVLHDVLTTATRRYPGLHVMLYPVRVQGEMAAGEIVRAIETLNAWREQKEECRIDLILLVRGGGSLEDLWAFNEESVARAIVGSRIPIATGIGHEPDTTIADLVGDLRGPTPTGVTELTIPDVRAVGRELDLRVAALGRRVAGLMQQGAGDVRVLAMELLAAAERKVREQRRAVEEMGEQVKRIEPRHAIAQGWRRVEEGQRRLMDVVERRRRGAGEKLARVEGRMEKVSPAGLVVRLRDRVEALGRQLKAVGPQAVLERGYSITTDGEGKVVRSSGQVKTGEVLKTRVAEGTITSTVGKAKQGTLF